MRLSLVFVNGIKGRRVSKFGAGGLGAIDYRPERPFRPGGPICIIGLPKKQVNPSMETYCVVHEIGHCLGLKHASEDTLVPNDKPSIMCGGKGKFSYSERIGKTALMPAHIDQVRNSNLLWWSR